MLTKLEVLVLLIFLYRFVLVIGENVSSCYTSSQWYSCDGNGCQGICKTYAILRANSLYSSLSNLSSYLSINTVDLAEANNGFATNTNLFSKEQPILIPIVCRCSNGGFFEAEVRKTTIKGEAFNEIAEFLEGLTTCKAIQEKNPSVSPWNHGERISLSVPLKCACPSSVESSKFLVSCPVKKGDTLAALAMEFNVTVRSIVSVNDRYSRTGFKLRDSLVPLSTLLIPSQDKPVFRSNFGYPSVRNSNKKRHHKKWMIGVYIAIGVVGVLASIATCFLLKYRKRKREDSIKNEDSERQRLSSSTGETTGKKISLEQSLHNLEDNYSFEELQKTTDGFSLSNLIEGSVYHGRLNGKDLAIKRTSSEFISRIDFRLFDEGIHHHPNIIRLLGTCVTEGGSDSFVVFEFAKNGCLKDWIHGGLAIKSQFIASCNCFLTLNQRLKICLDVANALFYMHNTINPSYVHNNITSRNIFLDEEFNAKVGYFGFSTFLEHKNDDQESCSNDWRKGYLAPEYVSEGTVCPSIDVFTYGVVVLEVLTGKPPLKRDDRGGKGSLIKLCDEMKIILQSEDAEELREWMDSTMGESYSFERAVKLANIARCCVEEEPSARPNAGEIVEELVRLVEESPEKY